MFVSSLLRVGHGEESGGVELGRERAAVYKAAAGRLVYGCPVKRMCSCSSGGGLDETDNKSAHGKTSKHMTASSSCHLRVPFSPPDDGPVEGGLARSSIHHSRMAGVKLTGTK